VDGGILSIVVEMEQHWPVDALPSRVNAHGTLARDFVELGDGIYAPRNFEVDFDDPRQPCQLLVEVYVDATATAHCRAARFLARPGEPDLGWDDLRIPLSALIDRAVAWVSGPLRVVDAEVDGTAVRLELVHHAGADAAPVRTSRRRRRVPLTEQRLAQIAGLYREALRSPDAGVHSRPRKYVRAQLAARGEFYSADTIAKWVASARDKGLLEKAPGPGKAGAVKKRRKR
jgi:hypothetical protein